MNFVAIKEGFSAGVAGENVEFVSVT